MVGDPPARDSTGPNNKQIVWGLDRKLIVCSGGSPDISGRPKNLREEWDFMLSYRPTLRSFAALQDDRKSVTPVL